MLAVACRAIRYIAFRDTFFVEVNAFLEFDALGLMTSGAVFRYKVFVIVFEILFKSGVDLVAVVTVEFVFIEFRMRA